MRKAFCILLVSLIFFSSSVYAFDTTLLDIRNKIFMESKGIKLLIPKSKDALLLTSFFDSYMITISQIDAYFSMLGIFESVKKENLNNAIFDYLFNWLNEIKKTNDLNLKSLGTIRQKVESGTQVYIDNLKKYYNELNKQINIEINKVASIKAAQTAGSRR
jgi:hypothetical protein